MSTNLELIVGTYEEFLLGYKLEFKDEKQQLVQSFADRSHLGALKCLAIHKHLIATGATDDRIFIYDMRTRKQSQILLSHQGTINALAFTPDATHLLSAGDDAKMQATRLSTWSVEATWNKAHSGKAVTHVSCHPSGKLALSLGADMVLHTWNLVKGRVAYKKNLKSHSSLGMQVDNLHWSPSGDHFSLTGQRIVEIWSIQSADVVRSQPTTSKPISLCWVTSNLCLVGQEDGKIICININEEQEKVPTFDAHQARVKSLACVGNNVASASSNGELKLWEFSVEKLKLREIASTNIGCRPTCIGLLDNSQFQTVVSEKEKKVEVKQSSSFNTANTNIQQNRGKVVIEYENDEENENKLQSKKNKNQKSKQDHDDDDDDDDEEDNDEEDDDDDEEDDDDDEEDDDDDDDDEENDDDDDNKQDDDDNDDSDAASEEEEEQQFVSKAGAKKRAVKQQNKKNPPVPKKKAKK